MSPSLAVEDACDHRCQDVPTRVPETTAADHDNDRLATELFRRFGSVQVGHFAPRSHWEAHADAIRLLDSRPTHSHMLPPLNPDPLQVPAMEQAAWDEGYEKGVRDSIPPVLALVLVAIVAAIVGGLAGWSIGMVL